MVRSVFYLFHVMKLDLRQYYGGFALVLWISVLKTQLSWTFFSFVLDINKRTLSQIDE